MKYRVARVGTGLDGCGTAVVDNEQQEQDLVKGTPRGLRVFGRFICWLTPWVEYDPNKKAESGNNGLERAKFEQWMRKAYPGVDLQVRVDNQYWSSVPDNFWEAWQARAKFEAPPRLPMEARDRVAIVKQWQANCQTENINDLICRVEAFHGIVD